MKGLILMQPAMKVWLIDWVIDWYAYHGKNVQGRNSKGRILVRGASIPTQTLNAEHIPRKIYDIFVI